MQNNDILRRIRYIFDLNDKRMMSLCGEENAPAERSLISSRMKRDEDPDFRTMSDRELAHFLNRFIQFRRGPGGPPLPEPESRLTNNIILKKLKIALALKSEDLSELFSEGGHPLGKSEIAAFFRKPGHVNYRLCRDQAMRAFLMGMRKKYRE